MHRLSERLYRMSSWPTVILASAIYALFIAQVMAPHAAEMRSFAGDWGAPDGHFFYRADKLYAEISTWGEAGRQHYVEFRLGLDPLWALTYTAFLISITSIALRVATETGDRLRSLNVFALVPMCADLLENLLGIILMLSYPQRIDWLAWLMAGITGTKWLTLGLAHVIMLSAIGLAVRTVTRRSLSSSCK